MILVERLSIFHLIRAPWGKAWVQSKFWLHPNFISRCRYPSGVIGCLLWYVGDTYASGTGSHLWHHMAVYWFAFWAITDMTDGSIARSFDLGSEEGQSIDPMSDKLLVLPPLIYLAYLGLLPAYLVVPLILFDILGQWSRRFTRNPAATFFGKAKTFLAIMTLTLVAVEQIYFPQTGFAIHFWTLTATVCFGFLSMLLKLTSGFPKSNP